jgi:hypothetical protein
LSHHSHRVTLCSAIASWRAVSNKAPADTSITSPNVEVASDQRCSSPPRRHLRCLSDESSTSPCSPHRSARTVQFACTTAERPPSPETCTAVDDAAPAEDQRQSELEATAHADTAHVAEHQEEALVTPRRLTDLHKDRASVTSPSSPAVRVQPAVGGSSSADLLLPSETEDSCYEETEDDGSGVNQYDQELSRSRSNRSGSHRKGRKTHRHKYVWLFFFPLVCCVCLFVGVCGSVCL